MGGAFDRMKWFTGMILDVSEFTRNECVIVVRKLGK